MHWGSFAGNLECIGKIRPVVTASSSLRSCADEMYGSNRSFDRTVPAKETAVRKLLSLLTNVPLLLWAISSLIFAVVAVNSYDLIKGVDPAVN